MALQAMRVPTIFTAQDKFSSVVNTMTKNTRSFGAGMDRINNRINNQFSSMNRLSQLAIAGGLGSLLYKAGQDIVDYEVKINSLAAVTGTKIGSMTKQIEDLGKKSSRSVIDIAGSFEIVGSKMSEYLDNPIALQKITDASILMAEAARMELEPAIGSLTGVMNIYKKSADDAYKVVNKLSAGETVGSVSIAQTTDILPQFGAQAVRANVTIEESIALVQALTKSLGVEGVGRGLRNILFDISSTKTWDKNRWKAVKMAGVDFEFVTNNANKLVDRLRELKKLQGTKGATELFFKRVNSIAANTLFQNFDKGEASFTSFLEKIKALDDAQAKANKNNATFATLWARTKDAFTNYIVVQNETNAGLNVMKGLLGWLKDNVGVIISGIVALISVFVAWKAIMIVTAAVNLALNIAMGISAFRAGAMAIAMQSNAVAIWIYEAATVIATGSTATLGITMTAFLAPVLGVVAVLGLLGGAMYLASDSSDNMASKYVSSLDKTNRAWQNSTSVQSREMKKQMDLMETHNPQKSIIERNKNMLLNFNLAKEKIKAATIQNNNLPIQQRLSPDALKYQVSQGDYDFEDNRFKTASKLSGIDSKSYKNLSGMQQLDMKSFSENMKQNVEVTIIDKGNNAESVKVNGKNYGGGLGANTGSTTGKF